MPLSADHAGLEAEPFAHSFPEEGESCKCLVSHLLPEPERVRPIRIGAKGRHDDPAMRNRVASTGSAPLPLPFVIARPAATGGRFPGAPSATAARQPAAGLPRAADQPFLTRSRLLWHPEPHARRPRPLDPLGEVRR